MSDDPLASCVTCGASVQRVFHPVAVHFKGSGFYNTDYGKTRGRSAEDTSSQADTDSGSGSDTQSGSSQTSDSQPSDSSSQKSANSGSSTDSGSST
jgi:hypothetical protein